jgi:hypothetical protein
MNLIVSIAAAALLCAAQHETMPRGMSHEEHLQQMEKQKALKKRGADVMGFDQDATTHHFKLTPDGGAIEVTAKIGADSAVVAEVRNHLRAIASEFARGNFNQPFQTHGEVPSGVSVMQKSDRAISYRYEDLPLGGAVRIETKDTRAREAVHEFLRYQITEHRTGDPLEVKR